MNNKELLCRTEYDESYPSALSPGRAYGSPKMHKSSSTDPYRRFHYIVYSIGTCNYNVAQYLSDLLLLLVSNKCSCKDTF